ncbi:hypothetical protein [Paracoccus sulfuroxidans]|uniref:Uncharacterized protein n=1 Tax=Paracoccus sulfuroxidans TaxID=384678 RepID=A0A562NXM7_9RHOB|nr:hypothetical protein [Paracoccus sulfuroxidans]TWI36919.1 hypothetical protein IQ24_00705 [Paracoccus sulfuroxidans]
MRSPFINQGTTPSNDGTVTRFVSPEVQTKGWYNPAKPVVFVNGMQNTGQDHADNANALSLMVGSPVYGVYNQSASLVGDLFQCLTDKMRLSGIQSQSAGGQTDWYKVTEVLFQIERKLRPGITKEDFVYEMLGGNQATKALYALLIGAPEAKLGCPIYCHSQGNLITSNALTGVMLARGPGAIAGLEVHSFGSPARWWPAGLNRQSYSFTFDMVAFLDVRGDWSSSSVGYRFSHGKNPFTHGFLYYAAHDPEFIINRFRTGGWGMTLNMDEKGLAKFCVDLRNNTDRLKRIFTQLENHHQTDSDDVAVHYVEMLGDNDLKVLQQTDPDFVTQLIRLLRSGIVAPDESRAVRRLRAVQPNS